MTTKTIYVSIGNSDDKLTQEQWANFIDSVYAAMRNLAGQMHGQWFSAPDSQWQNACWCVEVREVMVDRLKQRLAAIAFQYEQDSIAWAEATTEFIAAEVDA